VRKLSAFLLLSVTVLRRLRLLRLDAVEQRLLFLDDLWVAHLSGFHVVAQAYQVALVFADHAGHARCHEVLVLALVGFLLDGAEQFGVSF